MKLTVFTVDEANAVLVELRPRLLRLIEAKRDLDELQTRIEVLKLATAGVAADNPDLTELARQQERGRALVEQISAGVTAIQRRGALVKDLDRGLLDFYAVAGDRLIFLCWQMGESEVTHWHTLEGGYAQRQRFNHTELD